MNYKKYNQTEAVQREDGAIIFPGAAGWDAYQKFVEEGGITAPADQPAAVPEADLVKSALLKIDADVDAIFRDAVGNRAKEYEYREAEARALKASGYSAAAGPYLQDHIAASGLSKQAAADDVIAQADAWLSAMKVMSTQRLAAKAAVRAGNRVPAMAGWSGFLVQMRAAIGI